LAAKNARHVAPQRAAVHHTGPGIQQEAGEKDQHEIARCDRRQDAAAEGRESGEQRPERRHQQNARCAHLAAAVQFENREARGAAQANGIHPVGGVLVQKQTATSRNPRARAMTIPTTE
jgi:predicted phage gp36 major capsid-like protein